MLKKRIGRVVVGVGIDQTAAANARAGEDERPPEKTQPLDALPAEGG